MALLLTLLSGLFFLVGIFVYRFVKDKTRFANFSLGCALVVIFGLMIFDIIPELLEIKKWWLIIFVIIGLLFLLLADKFVPHHEHNHKENDDEKKEHQEHLIHISTVTLIALLLHNLIEGMALYGVANNNLKDGILMLLGIGLHNIPFGFQIASMNKFKNHPLLITLLVISGFVGGLIFSVFGEINIIVEGIIIAMTLGMLLHIFLFELLKEVWENKNKLETILGIFIGIIILIGINII